MLVLVILLVKHIQLCHDNKFKLTMLEYDFHLNHNKNI